MAIEERIFITRALGSEVTRVADAVEAAPSPESWLMLMSALHEQHPDVMVTAIGQRITVELWRQIYGYERPEGGSSAGLQPEGNPAEGTRTDDYLRVLLCDTLRRVTGPCQGPFTRKAATVVLYDLGRNIANAYHWHHLLLAVRRDGAVDPATETAIKECIREINGPWEPPKPRRAVEVRRAWNREMPAMVM